MSYSGISVKEAINKINNNSSGWFLPAVQRPYVWGSRHESENYICKLFDSILNGYPIGGLILWNTSEEIPYRHFMQNYNDQEFAQMVDKGLHSKPDKWLVYDGQQRLQTLYSCLLFTFNKRVLVFDLLSDPDDEQSVGFYFVDKGINLPWHVVRMTELFQRSGDPADKPKFRALVYSRNEQGCSEQDKMHIEVNVDRLWPTFVSNEKQTLAYFSIQESTPERKVNEIFERLNTGGMALSQADILLSRIKATYYDFEEQLQSASKEIKEKTGGGFAFSAYNILQLLFLLIQETTRVDPKKINDKDIPLFEKTWKELRPALISFFSEYLWGRFKINNSSIIPKHLAMLPLAVYIYQLYCKGVQYKNISEANLSLMDVFFIKSQVNDWNLQTYVDNFSWIISQQAQLNSTGFDFPLAKLELFVSEKGKRYIDVTENNFIYYTWFGLKILMPQRILLFENTITGRFNPEIDHIFPTNLINKTPDYDTFVDLIWNKQPLNGVANNLKRNHHPIKFLTDQATDANGKTIEGKKYVSDYDFIPLSTQEIDDKHPAWTDIKLFTEFRREKMIAFLKTKYNLELKP